MTEWEATIALVRSGKETEGKSSKYSLFMAGDGLSWALTGTVCVRVGDCDTTK